MSPPELPENLRDWPDDPFDVLGVRRGDDDAELKRAYTRLIRRFKPEHFPEQFRRIREAYETALEHANWFGHFRPPQPEPEPRPEPEPAAREPQPEPEFPPHPVIREPQDGAW